MGNQTCCFRPNEKNSEIKGGPIHEEIGEDYPHDSEQIRAEGNAQMENEGLRQVSNQQIYQEGAQSSNVGKEYNVTINSPNENEEKEQLGSNQNIQSQNIEDSAKVKESYAQDGNAAQNNYSPQEISPLNKEEINSGEGQNEGKVEEQVEEQGEEQVEEQGGEQVEEQGEEQVEEQGEEHGGEEVEHEEIEEQVEEGEEQIEQEQNEGRDPLAELGQTIAETTYINSNNNNNVQQNQAQDIQVQEVKSQEEVNQYYSPVENNTANNANSYLSNYNESGAFISATTTSSQVPVDLNNLHALSALKANDNSNQYIQQGIITTSAPGNIDLNNLGVANSSTENVDYNQYFQQNAGVAAGNIDLTAYGNISNVEASTDNEDLNKYFQNTTGTANYEFTNQTSTFDLNNLNLGVSSTTGNADYSQSNLIQGATSTGNIDLNSYGIQEAEVSANNKTTSYILPSNNLASTFTFAGQQGSTTFNEYPAQKVASSYAYPTQSYSYNYNYSVPATSKSQY